MLHLLACDFVFFLLVTFSAPFPEEGRQKPVIAYNFFFGVNLPMLYHSTRSPLQASSLATCSLAELLALRPLPLGLPWGLGSKA